MLLCLHNNAGTLQLQYVGLCYDYGYLNPRPPSSPSGTPGRQAAWRGARIETLSGKTLCSSGTISQIPVPVIYEVLCSSGNLRLYRSYPVCDNTVAHPIVTNHDPLNPTTLWTTSNFTPTQRATLNPPVNTYCVTEIWEVWDPNPTMSGYNWCQITAEWLVGHIFGAGGPDPITLTNCPDLPARQFTTDAVVKGINAGADLATYWHVDPPVYGRDLETHWHTRLGGNQDLALSWDTRTTTGAEIDAAWDTYVSGTVDLSTYWHISGPVASDLHIFWDTQLRVSQDLQLQWDVLGWIVQQLQASWHTNSTAGVQRSTTWHSYNMAARSFSSGWKVGAVASADLQLPWNIHRKTGVRLPLRWVAHEQTEYRERDAAMLNRARAALSDLAQRRGSPGGGFNPHRTQELYGGRILEPTAFEPDPATHRHEYYYNAVQDRAYRRVFDRREPARGIVVAHWQGISDPPAE